MTWLGLTSIVLCPWLMRANTGWPWVDRVRALGPIVASNQALERQIPWFCHPRSPWIVESVANMLAVHHLINGPYIAPYIAECPL